MKPARSEIESDAIVDIPSARTAPAGRQVRLSFPFTAVLPVVLFAAAICFAHLNQGNLSIDGVRYAHISNNIVRHNSWLTLLDEYGGEEYANKPPLLFWLTALSIRTFGYATWSSQLPSACVLFVGLLLLFYFCRDLYDERAGVLAIILYCCNYAFLRTYLHLGFEGFITCGVVCCLWAVVMYLRQGAIASIRTSIVFGLGILLLLESKPPYALLVLGPIALMLFRRSLLLRTLRSVPLLLSIFAPLALCATWIIFQKTGYVSRALNNQVATPLDIWGHYPKNLGRWLLEVTLCYQPLPIVALLAYRWRKLSIEREEIMSVRTAMQIVFLAMASLAIPIMLLVDCRGRYLIVPVLGLTCFTAGAIRDWLNAAMYRYIATALLALSLMAVVLLPTSIIKVHEIDPLVDALRHSPRTLQDGTALCLDGKRSESSQDSIKRTALLLDLEFGYRGHVYTSSELKNRHRLGQNHLSVLAERRCASALLSGQNAEFVSRATFNAATLLESAESNSFN